MKGNKRRSIALILAAVCLLALIIWTVWGNSALELQIYEISSASLPDSFDGYRIAQISDLHNAQMGRNNEKLLKILSDADPDLIAITGDLIDSWNTDTEIAINFIEEAVKIAPCYYVTGNHEARVTQYTELKTAMEAAGVVILENMGAELTLEGESIMLIGVDDPSFETDYLFGDTEAVMDAKLKELRPDKGFAILLSHRPELFETYVASHIDLVLTGHAHGGQFRLPLIGGLFAPNQGFFPKYDAGIYTKENTNMIVSRGIGNSIFPFRFNNRPEVVLIELQVQ